MRKYKELEIIENDGFPTDVFMEIHGEIKSLTFRPGETDEYMYEKFMGSVNF